MKIKVYTDGSCHTQKRVGVWGAIILMDEQKIVLYGDEIDTTHNRMELLAVIRAIEYIKEKYPRYTNSVDLYSDSQYVVGIENRKEKLKENRFLTAKGDAIVNIDLVQSLIALMESNTIIFTKVKAHLKQTTEINYNREVDFLVRKILRNLSIIM